jgi:thiamine biosynthesis lipoprotein
VPSPKSKPKLTLKSNWSYRLEAIGTHWEIDVFQPLGHVSPAALTKAIDERIEAFDLAYSRFRPDSLVSRMARAAGSYSLPSDAAPMMGLYRRLYDLTRGAVTPLIGQLLSDAGYDAEYSLKPGKLTPPPAWDDVMSFDPAISKLTLTRPALLDFGAAGKGYLVDLLAAVLEDHGLTAYCVDGSGDMKHRGPAGHPLRVGLEHPGDPQQAVGVVELENFSLCGSAGNRRAWANFHHIFDPRTLASPNHLQAVWVTAATTMLADGLTTALYFSPAAELKGQFDFEYALINNDMSLEHSAGFPGEFFTTPAA